jgi:hypothetical protein
VKMIKTYCTRHNTRKTLDLETRMHSAARFQPIKFISACLVHTYFAG